MICAFINDNEVKKLEEIEESEIEKQYQYYQQIIPVDGISPQPQVGWRWEKGVMYKFIPDVTPRQIRIALLSQGILLTDIDSALDSLPEPQRSMAKIQWEYSVIFERRNPLVESMGLILGWNSDDLDNLWIYAGTI